MNNKVLKVDLKIWILFLIFLKKEQGRPSPFPSSANVSALINV